MLSGRRGEWTKRETGQRVTHCSWALLPISISKWRLRAGPFHVIPSKKSSFERTCPFWQWIVWTMKKCNDRYLRSKGKKIHPVCCDENYFAKGKFKLFNSLFHSVYLVFSLRLFSIANLLAVRYLWDVRNGDKILCRDTSLSRHWRRLVVYLACLRSDVLRAYCNLESKQAISINSIWATPK